MSHFLMLLRSAALTAATILFAAVSSIGGTATATSIALTAATFVNTPEAQARPRVRDHRNGCKNLPNRNYCAGY